MIPKVIHYCWFGYKPKPKLIRNCIESWKRYMPEWEVREWNEQNYDVQKNEYIREAYKKKKWAFVVDYARFDILNRYGGIFLDTDVELLRPFPEEILMQEAFSGFENPGRVNPGLVYGSVSGQKILRKIMEVYEQKEFGRQIDGRIENIVDIVSNILAEAGLRNDGEFQVVGGVAIYPWDYFCCFDHQTQLFEKTGNTVSIHHYFASWAPWHRKLYFKAIKLAATILGKKRYFAVKEIICRKKAT